MIFRRALLRELSIHAVGAFFLLLAITLTVSLVKLLGRAASGILVSDAVGPFLFLTLVKLAPVLLSLTLFIAVLATLARAARDSELLVWFSSGVSLGRLLRTVLGFALPVALTVAAASLELSPWAERKIAEYRAQIDARSDIAAVTPGTFTESRRADRVFFVAGVRNDLSAVHDVFVRAAKDGGREEVIVAKEGTLTQRPDGERVVLLRNGSLYEGVPGSPEFRVVTFERYFLRVASQELGATEFQASSLRPGELKPDTPEHQAQWVWRLGMPVSALVLAVLAVPLSLAHPRAGTALNLILALIIYAFYNNALGVSEAWVAQGRISPLAGLLGVHLFMFAVAALLLAMQSHLWRGGRAR